MGKSHPLLIGDGIRSASSALCIVLSTIPETHLHTRNTPTHPKQLHTKYTYTPKIHIHIENTHAHTQNTHTHPSTHQNTITNQKNTCTPPKYTYAHSTHLNTLQKSTHLFRTRSHAYSIFHTPTHPSQPTIRFQRRISHSFTHLFHFKLYPTRVLSLHTFTHPLRFLNTLIGPFQWCIFMFTRNNF